MSLQIPLAVQLTEGISFSNFYVGKNSEVVHALEQCVQGVGESFIYLFGANGVGKSHLLQACCHEMAEQGHATTYIPLSLFQQFTPEIFQGLESMSLICIDDVNKISKNKEWEQALFHFYNTIRDSNTKLIISSSVNPASLDIQLPDLVSRLSWGLVIQLSELDDESKLAALTLRATQRGFDFPEDLGQFLLSRIPRDMHALFAVLDQLDEASLVHKRKLTIPFVRQLLES